jgi:hypothetical protein
MKYAGLTDSAASYDYLAAETTHTQARPRPNVAW